MCENVLVKRGVRDVLSGAAGKKPVCEQGTGICIVFRVLCSIVVGGDKTRRVSSGVATAVFADTVSVSQKLHPFNQHLLISVRTAFSLAAPYFLTRRLSRS